MLNLKKLLIVIAFAIIGIALPASMKAAGTVTLECKFGQDNVEEGSTVTVTCTAKSTDQQISAAEVHLNYPKELLEATGITSGTQLEAKLKEEINVEESRITVARGTFSDNYPTGDYVIFTATFKALKAGTADITLNTELPRKTNVLFGTTSVLDKVEGDSINILPPSTCEDLKISPNTARQGQTALVVTIECADANFGQSTTVNIGSDVSVGTPTIISTEKLEVTVGVNANAEVGSRTVSVTTDGKAVSKEDGFTVEESLKGATIYIQDAPYNLNVGETHRLTVIIDPGPTPVNGAKIRGLIDPKYVKLASVTKDTSALNKVIKDVEFNSSTGEFSYTAGVFNKTISEPFPILYIDVEGKESTPEEGVKVQFVDDFPPTDVTGPEGSVLEQAQDGVLHISSDAILVGVVGIEGRRSTSPARSWTIPLTIEFREPGKTTPIYTEVVTTERYGTTVLTKFTLSRGVPAGTYDIGIKGNHTLRLIRKNVKLNVGVNAQITFGVLREGDINGDNQILIDDYGPLGVAINSKEGQENYNPNADLDEDGDVDISDFSRFSKNLDTAGDTAIAASRRSKIIQQEGDEPSFSAAVNTMITAVDVSSELTATHTITFVVNPNGSAVSGTTLHYKYNPAFVEVLDFQLTDAPLDFVLEDPSIDAENGIVRATVGLLGETVEEPFAVGVMNVRWSGPCELATLLEPMEVFPETQVSGPDGNVLNYAENIVQHCAFLPNISK